jgi:DNA-binding NtrC family response regulator
LEQIRRHAWPGNVRELENVIQRAVVFAKSRDIGVEHLRLEATENKSSSREGAVAAGMTVAGVERLLILKTLETCGDNRTKAADMLGISIRTLRNKLHEYKLQSQ